MKIARIHLTEKEDIRFAVVKDDHYQLIECCPFCGNDLTDETIDMDDATLLPPVDPPQIVAVGLNYRKHAVEGGMKIPEAPVLFVKTCNTIAGPKMPILLPKMAPDKVDYECELVIVIGKEARDVSEEDALDYVLGYTCGNDVSARDCQLEQDVQWARGKCFDTFAPIGPWIETDIDGDNLNIKTILNGKTMQESNTSDLIFSCRKLVSYISRCMTLYEGSIIMTGTPAGVGFAQDPQVWLKDGDTITVEIEGIGALTNPVEKES